MKKRRKIFQRAAALLCCILLLPSLIAVSVSADSYEPYLNVLDLIDIPQMTCSPGTSSHTVTLPNNYTAYYVDLLFRCNNFINSLSISKNGQSASLNLVYIGSGVYRAYGTLTTNGVSNLVLNFNVSSLTYVKFFQFNIMTSNNANIFRDVGSVYNPSSGAWVAQSAPGNTARGYHSTGNFTGYISVANWRKYDYLDVVFSSRFLLIDNISVSLNYDYIVPFEVNYLGSSVIYDGFTFEGTYEDTAGPEDQPNWDNFTGSVQSNLKAIDQIVHLRLDLTELKKTLEGSVYIRITGVSNDQYGEVMLNDVIGYLNTEMNYWQKLFFNLKSHFADLKDHLTDLLGKDDPVINQAQQTQQQVDQEVNVQITQAMADWETNIVYAETGFTSGLTLVTPSVAWISLLATRIFDNMGGFGAVYIMVGFMSVIMLILSKSGVAAKIANSVRGRSGGKK